MKPLYLYSASSITCQPTFGNEQFNDLEWRKFEETDGLITPDYKSYIDPIKLRRTPKVNRMAMACAVDCLDKAGKKEVDAILVGTGLGCLKGTENFLNIAIKCAPDAMIPPTNFIQSGHNAISGQIALDLQNNGVNMTFAQQGFSFEHALVDAMMHVNEGVKNLLIGGVDENIHLLKELATVLDLPNQITNQLSEGSTFFTSGSEPNGRVVVADIAFSKQDAWQSELNILLAKNGLTADEKHCKLFVGYGLSAPKEMSMPHSVYTDWVGRYWSSSALGVHLAFDHLTHLSSSIHSWSAVLNFDLDRVAITLLKHV